MPLTGREGAYVWDVDGNRYLDTMMALGAVTLGYKHPYVPECYSTAARKGHHVFLGS